MKRLASMCLLFLLLLSVAGYSQQIQNGTPKMMVDQETFDAGSLYRSGQPLEHAFVLKNTGTADLNILSATPG